MRPLAHASGFQSCPISAKPIKSTARLFWRTNGRHSRIDPFPSALLAGGGQSRGERELERPIVVRQNASVGEKPRNGWATQLVHETNDTIHPLQ